MNAPASRDLLRTPVAGPLVEPVVEPVAGPLTERPAGRDGWAGQARLARSVVAATVRTCLRYRVTGLAAEAGFFALLSLPPLVLGMVAGAGFAGERARPGAVADLQSRVEQAASTFLTPGTVRAVIAPTLDEVVHGGRLEIVSIGFLLCLWSGSRALNVYVDTVSIMYGLGGRRGIVRTRLLSFSLYVLSLGLGVVVSPLVLLGPGLLSGFVAERLSGGHPGGHPGGLAERVLGWGYLSVVVLVCVAGLTTLYHVATPVRRRWRQDCPGAVLALLMWAAASVALHGLIAAAVGGASIYGPLAAPIVLLIWLYLLALAVLVGAALNAALDAALDTAPGASPDAALGTAAGTAHPARPAGGGWLQPGR